jgi:hypothetical protein
VSVASSSTVHANLANLAAFGEQITKTAELLDHEAEDAEAQTKDRAATLAETTSGSLGQLEERVLSLAEHLKTTVEADLDVAESGFIRDLQKELQRVKALFNAQKKRNDAGNEKMENALNNFIGTTMTVSDRLTTASGLIEKASANFELA